MFDSHPLRNAPPFQGLKHNSKQKHGAQYKGSSTDPVQNGQKQKKRPHDFSNASGRYWQNEKQDKKRGRFLQSEAHPAKHTNRSSRTTRLPPRPRSPRPCPVAVVPVPLSGERRGKYHPKSNAAMLILRSALARDPTAVGLLHDRDFKKSSSPNNHSARNSFFSQIQSSGDEDYSFDAIVGTCEDIEKDYLRLTSAPKPDKVRPPRVLKQSVAHIKAIWRDATQEYDWVCRQLKSVRQDYKVQHVENSDVVDVYETHARIALENKDLGEFNACVAQLQDLFHRVDTPDRIRDEFASYRILYNLLVGAPEWEQAKILSLFTAVERKRNATQFALQVRQAVVTGNYHNYFKLISRPPSKTMMSYILVHFHDRMRFRALAAMAAGYGSAPPGLVPLRFILRQLGWSSDTDEDENQEPIPAEKVCDGSEEMLSKLRNLGLSRQPIWIFRAICFLISSNVFLQKDPNLDGSPIDTLLVDFKASKAGGVRQVRGIKKLITHAGSDSVNLLK